MFYHYFEHHLYNINTKYTWGIEYFLNIKYNKHVNMYHEFDIKLYNVYLQCYTHTCSKDVNSICLQIKSTVAL